MNVVPNKAVLDVKPVAQHERDEEETRRRIHFEQQAREIIPIQVVRSTHPLNPLADKLKGVSYA